MLRVRLLAVALLGLVPLVSGCVGDEPTVALLVADGSDPATRAVDVEGFTGRELPVVSLGTLVPGSDRYVGLAGGDVGQQGSDLEAARDVLMGEEPSMTYVPTRAMSEQAADVALAYLADEPVSDGEDVDGVESWLYDDQEVTVDTLTSVLVAQGAVSLDDLCSGATEKRCARLGLR